MPFRLSNAPDSFSNNIIKILAKKLDVFIIMYMDYIHIFTKEQGQGLIDTIC